MSPAAAAARVAAVAPPPSDEEVAAIVAAVDALWPRPAPPPAAPAGNPWRFSGRSWARPLTARRDRPWLTYTQG